MNWTDLKVGATAGADPVAGSIPAASGKRMPQEVPVVKVPPALGAGYAVDRERLLEGMITAAYQEGWVHGARGAFEACGFLEVSRV